MNFYHGGCYKYLLWNLVIQSVQLLRLFLTFCSKPTLKLWRWFQVLLKMSRERQLERETTVKVKRGDLRKGKKKKEGRDKEKIRFHNICKWIIMNKEIHVPACYWHGNLSMWRNQSMNMLDMKSQSVWKICKWNQTLKFMIAKTDEHLWKYFLSKFTFLLRILC